MLAVGSFLTLRGRAALLHRLRGRELVLLQCLLMPLFQCLHLLLLLVTAMNCFTDRTTHWTTHILTPMIMAQHIPRTDAMGDNALLILTLGNMLPQTLHPRAMRSDRALIILVRAFCSMP